MLGDSNQLFNSDGWDHGWGRAAADRFGMYATGLISGGENDGNGAGAGFNYQGFSTLFTGQFLYSGAPAELHKFMPSDAGMYPLNYLYLPSDQVGGGTINIGMVLAPGCPIGPDGPLRFEVTFGAFAGATGWLQPCARYSGFPYTVIAESPPVSTLRAPGDGPARSVTLDLPAAPRTDTLSFRLTPWSTDMVGPVLVYTMRLENTSRPVGAAVHTLYARGGMSVRDMALGLQQAPDEHLSFYFSLVRSLQGPSRHVLIRLNSGLNDRNETEPSLGPLRIQNGRSAAAFGDNLQAVIDRLSDIWSLNRWDPRELFFLFTVSHPVSTPDDEQLTAYRLAAQDVAAANPRAAAIDPTFLTTSQEMLARGWYQAYGTDRNHLTRAAYEALSLRELAAAEGDFAWRDLTGDRRLDVEDLYSWHQSRVDFDQSGDADAKDRRMLVNALRFDEPRDVNPLCLGDANRDGRVSFADLTSVLAAWNTPGPPLSGDANADGEVSFADFTAVLANFNSSCN